MQPANFEEGLSRILNQDPRYHRDAYLFVREALDFTQKTATKASKTTIRHVSGQELLEGIRAYGLDQFGPMAFTVLHEWGVHRCEDFGEIVFNMVEHHLLEKRNEDSRADFQKGYDFGEAFRQPFLPQEKQKRPHPQRESTQA